MIDHVTIRYRRALRRIAKEAARRASMCVPYLERIDTELLYADSLLDGAPAPETQRGWPYAVDHSRAARRQLLSVINCVVLGRPSR